MNIALTDRTAINENGLQVRHSRHSFSNGASLTLTKSFSTEHVTLQNHFQSDQRQAALHFIFNGQSSFIQKDLVPPAHFSGDKCSLMLVQPNATVQKMSSKGDFLMASFYIELNQFISLLNSAAEALPEKFQRAVYKNVCSCNNFMWTPQAYYVINQLINTNTTLATSNLFIESKMLELIAVMLKTEHCDYYSSITIRKSDIEKIYFIKECLLADISACYTLGQLARTAGTNEFVLKKGFREIFGKPIYQYLMQKRMEKAMDLLLTTRLQVAEIALTVGYEDSSAFTRAFKKVFNLSPNLVRKNSTSA